MIINDKIWKDVIKFNRKIIMRGLKKIYHISMTLKKKKK